VSSLIGIPSRCIKRSPGLPPALWPSRPTISATLLSDGQGRLQFVIRFASLFDRKRTFANQWVFLDDQNSLRSGADPQRRGNSPLSSLTD
jgi:hypothetical protein